MCICVCVSVMVVEPPERPAVDRTNLRLVKKLWLFTPLVEGCQSVCVCVCVWGGVQQSVEMALEL